MALAPDRIDHLPLNDRPVIRWPNNARGAFWVAPDIEHYEYLRPLTAPSTAAFELSYRFILEEEPPAWPPPVC